MTTDVCKPMESIINTNVINPINTIYVKSVHVLNLSMQTIGNGLVSSTTMLNNTLNSIIDIFNNIIDDINKIPLTINSIINSLIKILDGSIFDIIRIIVTVFFFIIIPTNQINNVSTYVSVFFYLLMFIIFIIPFILVISGLTMPLFFCFNVILIPLLIIFCIGKIIA
jgi:hypothetical protein